MKTGAPQKNIGKNGRFENSRANDEASKLVNQWNEQQGQGDVKPLPMKGIIIFLAIASAVIYWFKNS